MQIITREEWGARPARSVEHVAWSKRERLDVHYSAGPSTQTPRIIQDFHMDTRGWSDVGYNFLVDKSGRIYEGRGWTVLGAHIAGHNTAGIGVCFIGRDGDVTEAAKRAIRWLYNEACRRAGRALRRDGHRDLAATSCPGDTLHAWVHAGMPVDDPEPAPAPAPSPTPSKPSSRPAPGPIVSFPLPSGFYFGPKDGPRESVSGHYGRIFHGRSDRDWLREWTRQLIRRGWAIGKGARWLSRYGNDGRYGDEYAALIRAFQEDQGLRVDGLLGIQTWNAAYRNPVT